MALNILAAAYGKQSFTEKVRGMVIGENSLTVKAANATFGIDPWPGHAKTLVIFFKIGDKDEQVVAVTENTTVTISEGKTDPPPEVYQPPKEPDKLRVIAAAYGPAYVTETVVRNIDSNSLQISVDNKMFHDSFPGNVKTFVGLFQFGDAGKPYMIILIEDSYLSLSS